MMIIVNHVLQRTGLQMNKKDAMIFVRIKVITGIKSPFTVSVNGIANFGYNAD